MSGPWDAVPRPGPGYGMAGAPSMHHEPPRKLGPWSAPQPSPSQPNSHYAPAPPSTAGAIPQPSATDELERLGRLREGGHLTDDEFARLKDKILD